MPISKFFFKKNYRKYTKIMKSKTHLNYLVLWAGLLFFYIVVFGKSFWRVFLFFRETEDTRGLEGPREGRSGRLSCDGVVSFDEVR